MNGLLILLGVAGVGFFILPLLTKAMQFGWTVIVYFLQGIIALTIIGFLIMFGWKGLLFLSVFMVVGWFLIGWVVGQKLWGVVDHFTGRNEPEPYYYENDYEDDNYYNYYDENDYNELDEVVENLSWDNIEPERKDVTPEEIEIEYTADGEEKINFYDFI